MRNIIYILAAIVITTLLIKGSYTDRGYWAVGGEWIWWIVPVMVRLWKRRRNENETAKRTD